MSRAFVSLIMGWLFLVASPALPAAELTLADVANPKGDGPDGKGNTADDTWQFWFELAHKPNIFLPLDAYSKSVPKDGVPRKIRGPIASMLPNPDDTEGFIYHSDWDGRFEGVWADHKAKQIMAYPYVEKQFHGAVAITYKVPADGVYNVTGGLTDLQVDPKFAQHDGIEWFLDLTDGGTAGKRLAKGGPIGDGSDRPDSGKFEALKVEAKKGQLIRVVVHPRKWWGSDLTRIDEFKIEIADSTK